MQDLKLFAWSLDRATLQDALKRHGISPPASKADLTRVYIEEAWWNGVKYVLNKLPSTSVSGVKDCLDLEPSDGLDELKKTCLSLGLEPFVRSLTTDLHRMCMATLDYSARTRLRSPKEHLPLYLMEELPMRGLTEFLITLNVKEVKAHASDRGLNNKAKKMPMIEDIIDTTFDLNPKPKEYTVNFYSDSESEGEEEKETPKEEETPAKKSASKKRKSN